MPLQISPPLSETIEQLREAIQSAIPNTEVKITGSGSRFEIRVVSPSFEGKSTLAKQRLVYSAIAYLMAGDNPPVHAVDRLETLVP
jgi:acid stress-induced BolA-like protein IbaG/YrbA